MNIDLNPHLMCALPVGDGIPELEARINPFCAVVTDTGKQIAGIFGILPFYKPYQMVLLLKKRVKPNGIILNLSNTFIHGTFVPPSDHWLEDNANLPRGLVRQTNVITYSSLEDYDAIALDLGFLAWRNDRPKSHALSAFLNTLTSRNCINTVREDVFRIGVGCSWYQSSLYDWCLMPRLDNDDVVHGTRPLPSNACRCILQDHCDCYYEALSNARCSTIKLFSQHVLYHIPKYDFFLAMVSIQTRTGMKVDAIGTVNDYSTNRGMTDKTPFWIEDDVITQTSGTDFDAYIHSAVHIRDYFSQQPISECESLTRFAMRIVPYLFGEIVEYVANPSTHEFTPFPDRDCHSMTVQIKAVHPDSDLVYIMMTLTDQVIPPHVSPPLPSKISDVVPIKYDCALGLRYTTIPREEYDRLRNVAAACSTPEQVLLRLRGYIVAHSLNIPEEGLMELCADLTPKTFSAPQLTGVTSILARRSDTRVKVAPRKMLEVEKRVLYLLASKPPSIVPAFFAANETNRLTALMYRVFDTEIPKPALGAWDEIDHIVFGRRVTPLTDAEYIDTVVSSKRDKALRTLDYILDNSIEPALHNPKFDSFIKVELNKTPDELVDSAPRLIQSLDDTSKHFLSKWTIPISKKLADYWSVRKPICYASGLTPLMNGYWMDVNINTGFDALFVETDFSKFDSTVSVDALRAELNFYKANGMDAGTAKLFEKTFLTVGRISNEITYRMLGGRQSGVPSTSVGNSYLNGIAHKSILDKMVGGTNYRLKILGDDMIMALNAVGASRFKRGAYILAFRRLGWNAKCTVHLTKDTAAFCSQYYYPCHVDASILPEREDGVQVLEIKHVLAPKIGRSMLKFGFYLGESLKKVEYKNLLRGQCLSRLPHCQVVPVLKDVILKYMNISTIARADPKAHKWQGEDVAAHTKFHWRTLPDLITPVAETDTMLLNVYGMNCADLKEMYKKGQGHTHLVSMCRHAEASWGN